MSSPVHPLRVPNPGNVQEVEVNLAELRKYPSVQEYYIASSKREDVPITYQNGLSNYSSLVLGDDRIMFKESLMTSTFKPKDPKGLTEDQIRNRAKPVQVRRREYIDAVKAVGWAEVDRMERNIRDKLKQRSFATSSPFQVRKSFKFFDTEKNGTLDAIGLTNALVFLGFEFGAKQILALFARYDTALVGTVDYMRIYKTCMEKNDDLPPIIPDVSHLGDLSGSRPTTAPGSGSVEGDGSTSALSATTGYTDDELLTLQKAEVKRIFSMLDKVGANSIDPEELELLLLALNINLAPNEMAAVKADLIGVTNGRVDFEDFFNWWNTRDLRK